MQGNRYGIERAFEDAKGECGLADYQALGWRSWHHYVTIVMLAMLFIPERRSAHQPGLELLTPRDIVEMLKELCRANPRGRMPSPSASSSSTSDEEAPSNCASGPSKGGVGVGEGATEECDSVKLIDACFCRTAFPSSRKAGQC